MKSSTRLFIEKPLSEADLLALSSEAERCVVADFGTESRRREALMWRYIVHRELGADAEISYNANGAPQVTNRKAHIGVSHSADLVAVIISDSKCAVDIERLDRSFAQVAARYIRPDEQALSGDERLPALLWSAKETLYKYADKQGLDFLRDVRILDVDFGNGHLTGQIEDMAPVQMQFEFYSGNVVVYIG